MERENALARGWSHVLSDASTLEAQEAELHTFRRKIGAPASAFQRGSWLHLDVMKSPRRRALADPSVRIFDTSRALVEYLLEKGVPRNVPQPTALP